MYGVLLGYNAKNSIIVEYAIPYQTAKRKPTEVEIGPKEGQELEKFFQ